MNEIMKKTFEVIDVIDNSEIVYDLKMYRDRVLNNQEIQKLIKEGNNCSNSYDKVKIKKKLYNYEEYRGYMVKYDELMFIVMKINNIYKSFTKSGRRCYR